VPVAKQVVLPLADWLPQDMPLIQVTSGESYIPVKPLVRALTGVEDDRPHRARIQRDPILKQLSCYLPVQTAGGTQDMLCLAWLGIGRFIDRLSLESVLEPYRQRVLEVMWGITFAAYEIVSGQRVLPALFTIVPSDRVIAAFRDDDAKKFLQVLHERVGDMENAMRDVGVVLSRLADLAQETGVCPCCKRSLES
jgi:hypothetical protein